MLALELIIVTIFLSSAASALRVTECKANSKDLTVKCPADSRIVVRSVSFAYDPRPCDAPSANNDCISKSSTLSRAVAARCNGGEACSINYKDPLSLPGEDQEELRDPTQCQIDDRFYQSFDNMLNYMAIVYDCTTYNFCTAYNETAKDVVVQTAAYPLPAPTNPNCECTFKLDAALRAGKSRLKAIVLCPGSKVVLRVKDEDDGDRDPNFYKEVECNNVDELESIDLATTKTSLQVWADEDKSDDKSTYKIKLSVLGSDYGYEAGAPVQITCKHGGLYLSKSDRTIVIIVVSVVLAFLVALIIVCRMCKRWRKKRRALREKESGAELQTLSSHPEPLYSTPHDSASGDSKCDNDLVKTKSASQLALEGKRRTKAEQVRDDPDGEDLVQFATLLHRKRLQEEELQRASRRSSPVTLPAYPTVHGPSVLAVVSTGVPVARLALLSSNGSAATPDATYAPLVSRRPLAVDDCDVRPFSTPPFQASAPPLHRQNSAERRVRSASVKRMHAPPPPTPPKAAVPPSPPPKPPSPPPKLPLPKPAVPPKPGRTSSLRVKDGGGGIKNQFGQRASSLINRPKDGPPKPPRQPP